MKQDIGDPYDDYFDKYNKSNFPTGNEYLASAPMMRNSIEDAK